MSLHASYFNLSDGFYNITLPGPAESATYILFATARNATKYYGGYRNITVAYGAVAKTDFNFTMYSLMDTTWGDSNNITLNDASNWNKKYINTTRKKFYLTNSTNQTLICHCF